MFESLLRRGFQIEFLSHAKAILTLDFPDAAAELEQAFGDLSIPIEEIIGSGGGEAKGRQRLRRSLAARDWNKINVTSKSGSMESRKNPFHMKSIMFGCFPMVV
ncbi:MAG: hypothetical protein M3Z96_09845 [Pseudomonadota bacterium]|nr:hypothetical protein [Pseudomonadota bacterium]